MDILLCFPLTSFWLAIRTVYIKGQEKKKKAPDKFNLQGSTAIACRQAYISIIHMIEQAIHHTYSGEAEEMSGSAGKADYNGGENAACKYHLRHTGCLSLLFPTFYLLPFPPVPPSRRSHCRRADTQLCGRVRRSALITADLKGKARLLELLFCEGQSRRLQSIRSPPSHPLVGGRR